MAVITNNVGELRRFLETYPDDMFVAIVKRIHEQGASYDEWFSIFIGESRAVEGKGEDIVLLFPHEALLDIS